MADTVPSDGFCKKCDRVIQRQVRFDGIAAMCCGFTYDLKGSQNIIHFEGHEPDEKAVNFKNYDNSSAKMVVANCAKCKRDTIHAVNLESGTMVETRFCQLCIE